jgi:hypothetical protein
MFIFSFRQYDFNETNERRASDKYLQMTNIQDDSKVLSGFLLIDHGNPDNNLESSCI